MKDFVKKYQKNKLITNINIVLASLVLAFWFNFLLVDNTNLWKSLKTSVLNSQVNEIKSDLYISSENWDLYIFTNKNINNLESLSLSLNYNSENVSILETNSSVWDIVNLTNTPWISSIILTNNEVVNLKKWDKIIRLLLDKKEDKTENLNIINANFKDINNETFLLSTSWITF